MTPDSPLGKPWRMSGTAMRPNVLLACKLLFLLLLSHGFYEKFRDPYLPFLPFLDAFRELPGLYPTVLATVFGVAGAALLLNWQVRRACVALGATVLLALLASKPLFQNHVFIVACLFFLCGLQDPDQDMWLLRLQFVVIYLGAAINKIASPDWWSGAFMHTWLHDDLSNPIYEALRGLLPGLSFAALVSWSVIASELVIVVLFLVRPWQKWAIASAVLMHTAFLALIGPGPFGYFTEDIFLGLLALATWPPAPSSLGLPDGVRGLVARLQPLIDWDRRFEATSLSKPEAHWLELHHGEASFSNLGALARTLLTTSAVYVALFVAYNLARAVL